MKWWLPTIGALAALGIFLAGVLSKEFVWPSATPEPVVVVVTVVVPTPVPTGTPFLLVTMMSSSKSNPEYL